MRMRIGVCRHEDDHRCLQTKNPLTFFLPVKASFWPGILKRLLCLCWPLICAHAIAQTSNITYPPVGSPGAKIEVRAASKPTKVIEYYNGHLDHYFVTALRGEINDLDARKLVGWSRTGRAFSAYTSPAPSTNPVCRFYIPPASGDSHFYSASPDECTQVKLKFPTFELESSAVMYESLPDTTTGACAVGTTPIYRAWNNRSDSNHRYVADSDTLQLMISRGYIAEGYGPDMVIMCAPASKARLHPFSKLSIAVRPGQLSDSESYSLRWTLSNGTEVTVPAFLRLGQTLESIVPWVPLSAADPGSGYKASYVIVNSNGNIILQAAAVSVDALPEAPSTPSGYFSVLLANVIHELLASHHGMPYVRDNTLDDLIYASDNAAKNLQSKGSSSDLVLADRVAKAILESMLDQAVAAPTAKSDSGPWWGSPDLVVQARDYANLVRYGTEELSDVLQVGSIACAAGSIAAGLLVSGSVLAPVLFVSGAGFVIASTITQMSGIVLGASLNVAAASMVGTVSEADAIPVAKSLIDFGFHQVLGNFTGDVGTTLCPDTVCEGLIDYAGDKVLDGAAEVTGWANNSTTEAQRLLSGVDTYVTPQVLATANAVPKPSPVDIAGSPSSGSTSPPGVQSPTPPSTASDPCVSTVSNLLRQAAADATAVASLGENAQCSDYSRVLAEFNAYATAALACPSLSPDLMAQAATIRQQLSMESPNCSP